MFDISFGELILVMVLAVVFIGPKELPTVVRACAKMFFHLKQFVHDVKSMMGDLAKEAGVDDIKREMEEEFSRDIKMIKGDDGEWYEAYDISDFVKDEDEVKVIEANIPSIDEAPTKQGKEGA